MRRNILLICLLATMALLTLSGPAFAAEVKEIIAEGTYCMGDGETPTVAEERALLQAKRQAVEQAGTYVESYSKTLNYQLTADEIQVISSGIMEVTVLDKQRTVSGSNINFWVKIRALVSLDKIEDMAAKVKEKTTVEDYKKLQEDYSKSQQEIAQLKQQLQQTNDDKEKGRIRSQITASETIFQASSWFERGNSQLAARDYYQAIESFSQAVSFGPNKGRAYLNRGHAYVMTGQYEAAIADFNTATAVDPSLAFAYYAKGYAYERLGRRQAAVQAYHTYIQCAPPQQEVYVNRARHRLRELRSWLY
ncbi:MAG: tetratricopeptide repeat protein [Negativicutes bacterium]|nr:tetratricopeptide repeat protein [Negativicutes bacterium]